ncbi:TPA: hypothetical protein ACXEZB_004380 [Escherichia coli]
MKNNVFKPALTGLKFKAIFLAAIAVALSGCQSYAALQATCAQGNVEACKTLASRNMMIGNAQAGLDGYNAQRLTEAQINALNAIASPRPTTTHCDPSLNGGYSCTTF